MDSGGDVACSREGRSVVVENEIDCVIGRSSTNGAAYESAGNGAGESLTFCCPS